MDFRHLKYFCAVAEEGNLSRAAKQLNISQPPLTRQIKQLEYELGVQLFDRTSRSMELTESGALFLKEAQNIRSLVDLAVERTQRAAQGELGRLDIAIFGSGILDTIPKILLAFRERHPEVSIHLHQLSKGEQITALRQRLINVGFNRLLAPLPDIISEQITSERLLLAVNERSALAAMEAIPFEEIANHPLILFPTGGRPGFIDKVISLCHESGFTPKVEQEVGDAVTGVALVASGFGICLVAEAATTLSLPGVVFRPFLNPPENAWVDLSCIYRADEPPPILQAFLKVVREFRHTGS
ncbi:MAG: LysR substrate-binding domain-containing protein [Magnetospiraceae bacterium]